MRSGKVGLNLTTSGLCRETMTFREGKILFKKYKIIKTLGSGGWSDVYLAEDTQLGRKVAVKHLRPEVTKDKIALGRFLTETRIIASLNHRNIITIFDYKHLGDQHYMIMEYAENGTLKDLMKSEKQLSIAKVLDIATDICLALDVVHAKGIIHRDIKPSNVLFFEDSEGNIIPKLADFSIALASLSRQDLKFTTTGSILGTTTHMAPEQESGQTDARSDIYAIGVVLYEMLTGQLPYAGSEFEIIKNKLERDAIPPIAIRQDIPDTLNRLVMKALSRKPEDRFQTAQDMAEALQLLKEQRTEIPNQIRFPKGANNPYQAGRPISSPEMFFGREDVFDFLKQQLIGKVQDNIVVLHGQRRTGKTSILYQIQVTERLGPDVLPVLIDLQGIIPEGLASFVYQLADEIANRVKVNLPDLADFQENPLSRFQREFLPEIWQKLKGRRLLLMLDEFELLETYVRESNLDQTIFSFLRTLIQHEPNLAFLFAGTHKFEELDPSRWELLSGALYKKISFLDQKAAHRLITEPVKGILKYESEAIDTIFQLTSGHPYYVQLVCSELFSVAISQDISTITSADVKSITESLVERATPQLVTAWNDLSTTEKLVLAATSTAITLAITRKRFVSAGEIRRVMARSKAQISEDIIDATLASLTSKDLLIYDPSTSQYHFAVDLLRLWIDKQHSLDELLTVSEDQEVEIAYQRARQYFAEERFDDAVAELVSIIQTSPNYKDAGILLQEVQRQQRLAELYDRADALIGQAKWNEASDILSRLLAVDSNYKDATAMLLRTRRNFQIETLYQEAMRSLNKEEWRKAAVEFEQILQIDPTYRDATVRLTYVRKQLDLEELYLQALSFLEQENWQNAFVILQRIFRLDPNYKDAAYQLARVREQLGLERLYEKGLTAHNAEEWKKARELFESVVSVDRDYKNARVLLSQAEEAYYENTRFGTRFERYLRSTLRNPTIITTVVIATLVAILSNIVASSVIFETFFSPTPTSVLTPSPTGIVVVVLATSTPTSTPIPTETLVPPSPTPTSSPTKLPTLTPTITNTPVPETFTPTSVPIIKYQNGPILNEPSNEAFYSEGDLVRFNWEGFNLAPDQYYSIQIVPSGASRESACIHAQTKEPQLDLTLNCPPGIYTWSAAVVAGNIDTGFHQLSIRNDQRQFFLLGQIPAPTRIFTPTPTNTSTPTPTPLIPPILINPRSRAIVSSASVTLNWEWPGVLAEDEYFQIEIWFENEILPIDVGWIKNTVYTTTPLKGSGQYSWWVTVVRGTPGSPKPWNNLVFDPAPPGSFEVLSVPSEMRSFFFTP